MWPYICISYIKILPSLIFSLIFQIREDIKIVSGYKILWTGIEVHLSHNQPNSLCVSTSRRKQANKEEMYWVGFLYI